MIKYLQKDVIKLQDAFVFSLMLSILTISSKIRLSDPGKAFEGLLILDSHSLFKILKILEENVKMEKELL